MNWLIKRLNEPSSHAGLGVFAAGLSQVVANHSDVTGYIMIASGLGAFMFPEKTAAAKQ